MTAYDPKIIQEFADRLYAKAKSIIFSSTLSGIFLIGVGGLAIGIAAKEPAVSAMIGSVIGGFIGYSIGKEKAFQYKLQAQTVLCQVKIEENSRKTSTT